LDSGNSYLSFPAEYILAFLNTLGRYGLDCNTSEQQNKDFKVLICTHTKSGDLKFPDLRLAISGATFKVPGSSLVQRCVLSIYGSMYSDEEERVCTIKIEFQQRATMIILGKPFNEAVDVGVDVSSPVVTLRRN